MFSKNPDMVFSKKKKGNTLFGSLPSARSSIDWESGAESEGGGGSGAEAGDMFDTGGGTTMTGDDVITTGGAEANADGTTGVVCALVDELPVDELHD